MSRKKEKKIVLSELEPEERLKYEIDVYKRQEVDDVENYVVALGIRGYKKWKEMWVRQSPHADAEDMLRWNAFREKFIEKLESCLLYTSRCV